MERFNIIPILRCNLNCKLCCTKNLHIDREIPFDILKNNIIRIKKHIDFKELIWGSIGELFLYKDFFKILDFVFRNFRYIEHNIVTNGTIDRFDEFPFIYDNKVGLSFSVDVNKDYHDWNRGYGNYDKTLSLIEKFYKNKKKVTYIGINMIVDRENVINVKKSINEIINLFPKIDFTLLFLEKFNNNFIWNKRFLKPNDMKLIIGNISNKVKFRDICNNDSNCKCLTLLPTGFYNNIGVITKVGNLDDSCDIIMKNYNNSKIDCSKCIREEVINNDGR